MLAISEGMHSVWFQEMASLGLFTLVFSPSKVYWSCVTVSLIGSSTRNSQHNTGDRPLYAVSAKGNYSFLFQWKKAEHEWVYRRYVTRFQREKQRIAFRQFTREAVMEISLKDDDNGREQWNQQNAGVEYCPLPIYLPMCLGSSFMG